tara:strand:- start:9252 stop:9650 length:399 start_codon:yes stop_codon:yes gene_type:complete
MDQQTSHKLHALCEEKRELKLQKASLSAREDIVDNEIVKLVGTQQEGSLRMDNGAFRVVTTSKLNRRILPDELAQIQDSIPEVLSPFVSKTVLDMKKLRALELGNPELYKYCCRAIESKNGKVNVKVEVNDA